MPKHATFRFYEELNDFLPREKRKKQFTYEFAGTPSVKDAVEAIGVPHAEIDLILVNGRSVAFTKHIKEGDMISVYPVFESLDIGEVTRLRPKPLRTPKFIADANLGKLAKYLRLLGFDTLYDSGYGDAEVVDISRSEGRAILTRDISLLKRGAVTHGYWIRSHEPKRQTAEVVRRFDLRSQAKPFSRCTVCNGVVKPVPKDAVIDMLAPKTKRYFKKFFQCCTCGNVYWKGSHYDNMTAFIDSLLAGRPE